MISFLNVHVTLNILLCGQEIYSLPYGKIQVKYVPDTQIIMNDAQWYCSAAEKEKYIKFIQDKLLIALTDVCGITQTYNPISSN